MSITINNVTAGYDRHPVVHHLSGSFADASLTAVSGPNGGGKSTLLKALVGFVPLMTGRIDFGGVKPDEIAYLPQQFEIDRTFPISVLDVVLLGNWSRTGAFAPMGKLHRKEALDALAEVDMAAFASRPVVSLSTGQWQRVLFARIIVQRARLILLDEPFAAIDGHTTLELMQQLKQWCRNGVTIICVMHDLNLVRAHFPQSLLLSRELIAWGNTADVLTQENLDAALERSGSWQESLERCEINGEEERSA
ncbi:metal ABC transporter ATP-binding protein [Chlorobium ferrooxidans]|uniref:ABC transporter related n=1 Tax=Chlorobium ferrooxidans DSM 13031 TaxID=377431 RepID=Q0YQY9_9CHLB|nr:ABC transporter ATP-binding protein [Chlorobium ferrooxidans]EAT58683.1 ABC transporter related [Chlorobium ferrooxidans DSM 13031]